MERNFFFSEAAFGTQSATMGGLFWIRIRLGKAVAGPGVRGQDDRDKWKQTCFFSRDSEAAFGPSEREEQSEAGRSSLPTAKAKSRPKSKPKAKAKAKVNQPKKRAQEPKGKAQAKKKSAKRARSKDDVQKRMHSATRLKHLLLFQSLLLKTLF